MKTPKFWRSFNIISLILLPLSLIYLCVSQLRFKIYSPKKFKPKVICIGNINVGGSGKTPVAIMIGKYLQAKGYKVAYACKNHTGSIVRSIEVNLSKHNSKQVLDEALLLAKIAPTFVAKSRRDAIAKAASSKDIDFVISDDGLQNNSFYKDWSLLVIDGQIGFGNNLILPAGPLREPLGLALARKIDYIFVVNNIPGNTAKKLKKNSIINLATEFKLSSKNAAKKYIAFAGLAYPEKFFAALEKNMKLNVVKTIDYPDHYDYKIQDFDFLISEAKRLDAKLITTEKDLVRIPSKYAKDIDFLIMTMVITKGLSKLEVLHS